ncbi:glycosyltransferase [Prevotella sp. E13-17]|uniref:glycosyltransferase family 2 protein n=1 Tax=Prevotella sp. E13-17 TaxID=2913616 RepID=UPI001ED9D75E|nr:glycosyltransferase family 2 protein [Prevotella sp. E13-17]UKK50378.1 glycosyltransferase [Prevotella sp. E13-17]
MRPKVSIIVPCWGVEQYLDRCVNSLVNQTLRDIEIILVDDESPDRVPEMCDAWAKKDDRIKVVHKKNGGLGYARNTGLDNAGGEYVMFLDSDDTYELDVCERFYNVAKQYDADIVTGNFNTEYMPGKWRKTDEPVSRQVFKGIEVKRYMLDVIGSAPHISRERQYPVSVCLLCTKRNLIESNSLRFKSERDYASEDTLFKIPLLKHARIIVCEPYAFYNYYLNNGSLTHTFRPELFDKTNNLMRCLDSIVGDDAEARLRIRRFVSSEHRMQIIRLVQSNRTNKLNTLREYLKNPIWKELSLFKPSYFPIYSRIFHQLCLWDMPIMVYLYSRLIIKLKNR